MQIDNGSWLKSTWPLAEIISFKNVRLVLHHQALLFVLTWSYLLIRFRLFLVLSAWKVCVADVLWRFMSTWIMAKSGQEEVIIKVRPAIAQFHALPKNTWERKLLFLFFFFHTGATSHYCLNRVQKTFLKLHKGK